MIYNSTETIYCLCLQYIKNNSVLMNLIYDISLCYNDSELDSKKKSEFFYKNFRAS